MIALRPSRSDDVDALYGIWEAAVKATHHFLTPQDFAFFAELVRAQYLPAGSFCCAVDGEDRPLAFIGMTGAKVDALFVAPDHHGQGLGRLLLDHVRRRASAPLTLDVNEQNVGAVAFYRRMGFRVTRRSVKDDSGRPYPLLHMILEEGA